MCSAIVNPASCEIRAVIRFLRAKIMSAAEIHRELGTAFNRRSVMSEGTVRQWSRMSKGGRKYVHDEQRSGRPSIVSDELVQNVDKKLVKGSTSEFHDCRVNFHKFHVIFSQS
jgi:transposase